MRGISERKVFKKPVDQRKEGFYSGTVAARSVSKEKRSWMKKGWTRELAETFMSAMMTSEERLRSPSRKKPG